MNYSKLIIPSNIAQKLDAFQQDFLVKSGWAMFANGNYTKSVKNEELHIVLSSLVKKNIPFRLETPQNSYTSSKRCTTCKK
jgi:hypothetical protein